MPGANSTVPQSEQGGARACVDVRDTFRKQDGSTQRERLLGTAGMVWYGMV